MRSPVIPVEGTTMRYGTVTAVNGIDVAKILLRAQGRIGVLPDAHGLYPRPLPASPCDMTGRLQGMEDAELEQRIDSLVELLDMGTIADRRAPGFSHHGERMKVSLGRPWSTN